MFGFSPGMLRSFFEVGERAYAYPTRLQIEPSSACNLHCVMCPIDEMQRPKGIISFENFKKIVDKVPSANVLSLTGIGEPTMNRALPEMVAYAKARGMTVGFASNGTLFTQELAEKLVQAGLDHVSFSIDGGSKEAYEKIRLGGKFERAVGGAELVLGAKKRLGRKTPYVKMTFLIQRDNILNLKDIVQLIHDIHPDGYATKHLANLNEKDVAALAPDLQSEVKVAKAVEAAVALAESLGELAMVPQLRKFGPGSTESPPAAAPAKADPDELRVCLSPWYNLTVNWNGAVSACCFRTDQPYDLGNLLEQSLDEVWQGEKYRRFRKALIHHRGEVSVCRTCPVEHKAVSLACNRLVRWLPFLKPFSNRYKRADTV